MGIFGIIESDDLVQTNEKVRISASESFISKGESAITVVEIKPSATDSYITVSGVGLTSDDWYTDWVYTAAATNVVTLRITTNGTPATFTKNIVSVTSATDALFSTDDELKKYEPDIMKWLPAEKSTWNFIHRKVQDRILTEIYKSRIFADNGDKLTKTEVVDVSEVREWATQLALSIIFMGISNSVDDVFSRKSSAYLKLANQYREYSMNILKLDFNKDGSLTASDARDFRSGSLRRV